MHQKKAQSAMEFLMTYSWAILVVLITIAGLYYFGIFNFTKFTPSVCDFDVQFSCTEYTLQPDTITLRLIHDFTRDIEIDQISIVDGTLPFGCTNPSLPLLWAKGAEVDLTFTNCGGGSYIPGERVELEVDIEYHSVDTPNMPRHTVSGLVSDIVVDN